MGWACVYTYWGCELKAVDNLVNQGYEAFCPVYRTPDPRDFKVMRTRPLFPSYAFVSLEMDQRWASINSTIGVIRLLTVGLAGTVDRHPIFLSDGQVDQWRGSERVDKFELPAGTRVRIKVRSSPFHNFEGTVCELTKSQRVRVFLNMFNRDAVVTFESPNDLERVETA